MKSFLDEKKRGSEKSGGGGWQLMEQANTRLLELSGLGKNIRHNALMHDKGVIIVKVHASLIANSIQPTFSTKG